MPLTVIHNKSKGHCEVTPSRMAEAGGHPTVIRSTLDYTFRTMLPTKKWVSDIDNHTPQVIKKAFHLPKTICTPALHCAWKSGGLGLLCIVDLHIVWVSQAFKFLINKDIHVKSVVVEQLRAMVKARARYSPLHWKTLQFLNAQREIPTYQSDIRSCGVSYRAAWSRWLPNSWRVKRTWSSRWETPLPQQVSNTKSLLSCGSLDIRSTWKSGRELQTKGDVPPTFLSIPAATTGWTLVIICPFPPTMLMKLECLWITVHLR